MRSLAVGLTASALLLLSPPANAHEPTGTMTRYVWSSVHAREALAAVEAACGCTGARFGHAQWKGPGGHLHRVMVFQGTDGQRGIIYFRQRDDRSWHANPEKQWWDSGSIPVDQVTWVRHT